MLKSIRQAVSNKRRHLLYHKKRRAITDPYRIIMARRLLYFFPFLRCFLRINEFVASNAQTQISRLKILIFNLSPVNTILTQSSPLSALQSTVSADPPFTGF